MALSKEEQDQLDALTAKANEPDGDDDYEIEIWDHEGNGARVPYRKGKSWLNKFGIDLPEATDDSDNDGESDSGNGGNRNSGTRGNRQPAWNNRVSTTQKYFGKRTPNK